MFTLSCFIGIGLSISVNSHDLFFIMVEEYLHSLNKIVQQSCIYIKKKTPNISSFDASTLM